MASLLPLLCATSAFVVQPPLPRVQVVARTVAPVMVDIPRVDLPSVVTDVLKEADLKNPNDMTATAYNEYSAAAIGGTLLLFLLPIFNFAGFIGDFIFSALIGGGALAYGSLRSDVVGEYANKAGGYVMKGIDATAEQVPVVKAKVEQLIKQVQE